MSWRRLQHVFSVTIFCVPRRLEDVLKTHCNMSWRCLEDVLEDKKLLCWRHLQDVLKTFLEDVLETDKILLGISVSKKFKCVSKKYIFDALPDLVPFVKFKNREKHPWRSVNFRLQPATLLKLTLLHGCFSRFSNCTNSTKSRNASHITAIN